MAMVNLESQRQKGVGLIEVVVAAAIALIIMLGILPLFISGLRDTVGSRELSTVASQARGGLEEKLAFGAGHWSLQVQGANTETTLTEDLSIGNPREIDHNSWGGGGAPRWSRAINVRYYGLGAFDDLDNDGVLEAVPGTVGGEIPGLLDADENGIFDNPLPGNTAPAGVHIRRVDVLVDNLREGGILGLSSDLEVQSLIAF